MATVSGPFFAVTFAPGAVPERRASEMTSTTKRKTVRVAATTLLELPPKTSVMRIFDGAQVLAPKRVDLLPYYEDEGWRHFDETHERAYQHALRLAGGDAQKARALVAAARARAVECSA